MTARGKIILTLLILGVAGLGVWKWYPKLAARSGTTPSAASGNTRQAESRSPSDPGSKIGRASCRERVYGTV